MGSQTLEGSVVTGVKHWLMNDSYDDKNSEKRSDGTFSGLIKMIYI